jgi:hypothetical protein
MHLGRALDLGLWLWLNGIPVPVPLAEVQAFCPQLCQLPTWTRADCYLHLMSGLPPNFQVSNEVQDTAIPVHSEQAPLFTIAPSCHAFATTWATNSLHPACPPESRCGRAFSLANHRRVRGERAGVRQQEVGGTRGEGGDGAGPSLLVRHLKPHRMRRVLPIRAVAVYSDRHSAIPHHNPQVTMTAQMTGRAKPSDRLCSGRRPPMSRGREAERRELAPWVLMTDRERADG